MTHPTYKAKRAALNACLKKLGLTRNQLNHLRRLSDEETWAYTWQHDDWPHAR